MNCQTFTDRLDQYLEGTLACGDYNAAAAHLQRCAECRNRIERVQTLRVALRNVPVPAPGPEFFDQAIIQAQGPRSANRMGWAAVTGAALAASLALWIGIGWFPGLFNAPATKPIGVTIALHQTRTVQLAFNAERDLTQATLRITLPDGVELQGFPGEHEVSWKTNIARGANVLSLPLTAVSSAGGKLLARLEHGDRSTQLSLPLYVSSAVHGTALPSSCITGENCKILREKNDA